MNRVEAFALIAGGGCIRHRDWGEGEYVHVVGAQILDETGEVPCHEYPDDNNYSKYIPYTVIGWHQIPGVLESGGEVRVGDRRIIEKDGMYVWEDGRYIKFDSVLLGQEVRAYEQG